MVVFFNVRGAYIWDYILTFRKNGEHRKLRLELKIALMLIYRRAAISTLQFLVTVSVVVIASILPNFGFGQMQEETRLPQLKTIQLYMYNNQLGYPVLELNSADRMELHFDDMDANIKNYSYTFQLCNADWTPAMASPFDYISGFMQQRISNYRTSNVALTRYTHYQAVLPDRNCAPRVSGNYILKVFPDGDTSKLAFSRRFLVFQNIAMISAEIVQPFNANFFRTHQKVEFKVNSKNLQVVNAAQQMSVTILQNARWDNAVMQLRPVFMTNNILQFNTETEAVFPAGKEWRWLDLRSLRLQSDRVDSGHYFKNSTEIFVKPTASRSAQQFNFYGDNDGMYYIATIDNFNPLWQADYAIVHFAFVPAGNSPYTNKDLYLFGELTNYGKDPEAKMRFNPEKGIYETAITLKQGYYDVGYATIDKNDIKKGFSFEETEGNYWETENSYMILVYYRPLGGRYDQLVGLTRINSLTGRLHGN